MYKCCEKPKDIAACGRDPVGMNVDSSEETHMKANQLQFFERRLFDVVHMFIVENVVEAY